VKCKIIVLILLAAALLICEENVLAANASNDEIPSRYEELVEVIVNCTSAEVGVSSAVIGNTTFVHFPPGIDMSRTELTNVILISVGFSRVGSGLFFLFDNNTDTTTATSLANSVKDSIETAFETSFTWLSTSLTEDNYVNVTYTGSGKSDLPSYLNSLMEKCLAPDLGSFTLTFIPMSNEASAYILVSTFKESEDFDWMYSMGVSYSTNIPVGAGEHKIDLLNLLNVESLTPSPQASSNGWVTSMVTLTIVSNETVSYKSSEPGLANPMAGQLRGWYVNPTIPQPPAQLIAYFSFADDPTPVDKLSLTFAGLVLPEFNAATLLTMLMLVVSLIVIAKKKIFR